MDLKNAEKAGSLWTDWKVLLWNLAMVIFSVPILAKKLRRHLRGGDGAELDLRRWSLPDLPGPSADGAEKHVLFAGASYGEMLVIARLSDLVRETNPEFRISWILRDEATLDFSREHFPNQDAYLWPFDFIVPVDRLFRELKPTVLVLIERFRFPNLLRGAKRHNCSVVLVNGRLRKMHWLENTFLGGFYRWVLQSVDVALMQSEEYAQRAKEIAGDRLFVKAVGDIKEGLPSALEGSSLSADLGRWLWQASAVPLLAAGSTEDSHEETFVLQAFKTVRKGRPCKLVLAPRNILRITEVAAMVRASGLSFSLRSENDSSGDVLILDTLGELAIAYGSTMAAYVGGALNGMGHNVLEPVAHGIPVSYGMRRGHFGDLQMRCEEFGVGFRINTPQQLADHWLRVLDDEQFGVTVREQTRKLLANNGDSGHVTSQMIHDLAEGMPTAALVGNSYAL